MALLRAQLVEIDASPKGNPVGEPLEVQFNPTSLRLQTTNNVTPTSGSEQPAQYTGTSSTTLTAELVFDTADEGTTGSPVDVRDRTRAVVRFVLPSEEASTSAKQAPPRVRFRWGTIVLDGVMTSLTEDLDLFAVDGVPLRAKLSVTIREQDPKLMALQRGAGANRPPGSAGFAGPGGAGGGGDRTAFAIGGETSVELAARVGLDPAAWRAVASAELSAGGGIGFAAGAQVDFSAGLSATAGLGASAGFAAGLGASAGAGVSAGLAGGAGIGIGIGIGVGGGLSAGAGASFTAGGSAAVGFGGSLAAALDGPPPATATGGPPAPGRPSPPPVAATPAPGAAAPPPAAAFALTAAGGVTAAIETVRAATAGAEAGAARAAFGRPGPAATAAARPPARPPTPSGPSGAGGPAGPARAVPSSGVPPRPVADARALAFGRGIPLRPPAPVSGAVPGRTPWVVVGREEPGGPAVEVADPTAPPWARLPAGPARAAADRAQASRSPGRCSCRSGCGGH